MSRRTFFSSFGSKPPDETFKPHRASPGPAVFTNALLTTHEGKKVRFYDDLIKGRQVLINMMYATCEGGCPAVTSRLVRVHENLKDRMGKNLFIYSITVKPEDDNPEDLKRYAKMHGALLPGWTFLTGDPYDIETIRYRLFRMDHIWIDTDIYSHTSFMLIINDSTNRWLHVDPLASMYTVMTKISWADPPKSHAERVEEYRRLQEQINKEVKMYGYRKTV